MELEWKGTILTLLSSDESARFPLSVHRLLHDSPWFGGTGLNLLVGDKLADDIL